MSRNTTEDGSIEFSSSVSITLYAPLIANSLVKPDGFLCTSALNYVLQFISAHNNWQLGMRTKYHNVLDQLVAFLFSPQNIEKYAADWKICRIAQQKTAAPAIARFHEQMHVHAAPSTFNDLIARMCSFLESIVEGLQVKVQGEDQLWPMNASALFPGGAKNAVLNLLQWFHTTESIAPLNLLVALLRHLPSDNPLLSALVETPSFISAIADDFKKSVEKIKQLKRTKRSSPEQVHLNCYFFTCIKTESGPTKYETLRSYMRLRGQVIYDALGVLLDIYGTLFQKEVQAMVLMSLYTTPLTFAADLVPPGYVAGKDANTFLNPSTLLRPALKMDKPMCAKALCPNANTATTATLSLCSGCRLVHYCSPACQRAAWAWKPMPHKVVCKDFAKLAIISRETSNDADFKERLWAGGFGDTKIREMILARTIPQQAGLDAAFNKKAGRVKEAARRT
ncbi:hypothetical protein B0H11DRAFT_2422615 [Mycena galericulata]|nr:hypothetical protein B0H11DRAFT_2422615 [Mycena galericulata]